MTSGLYPSCSRLARSCGVALGSISKRYMLLSKPGISSIDKSSVPCTVKHPDCAIKRALVDVGSIAIGFGGFIPEAYDSVGRKELGKYDPISCPMSGGP